MIIDGDLSLSVMIDGDADLSLMVDGEEGLFLPVRVDQYYTGETEITPSAVTQVLQTQDLVMATNITINPIPSNYGKVTYNGSDLLIE